MGRWLRASHRWLDWLVALFGALLLAASFLPWYHIAVGISGPPGGPPTTATVTADAWQASSQWTIAIVLGVVAALVSGAVALGMPPPRWLVWTRLVPVGLVALALLLVALPRLQMNDGTVEHHVTFTIIPVDERHPPTRQPEAQAIATIVRDHLSILHVTGYESDLSSGFALGAGLVTLELAAAAAALLRRRG